MRLANHEIKTKLGTVVGCQSDSTPSLDIAA